MRIKILAILLLFSIPSFAQFDYVGIGVFKAKKGDTINILPERAYIINEAIFNAGLKAFEYVDSKPCEPIKNACDSTISNQAYHYQLLSWELDSCLMQQEDLINEYEIRIKNLQLLANKQSQEIDALEMVSKRKSELMKVHKRKARRRSFVMGVGLVALVTKLGFDYFAP